MNTDVITAEIVDAAYHLHRALGPGRLESAYERPLAKDLDRRGLQVERQRPVTLVYDGIVIENAYVVDLLVNGLVVVELKAVEKVHPIHIRQTYTYMRLLGLEVGLLLNFGAPLMKDGIHRIVNGYRATPDSRIRIERGGSNPGRSKAAGEWPASG